MTLAIAVVGRASIWTAVDRRLTFAGGARREDARKIMFLETTDAVAILAYAGLGITEQGTEPADWMSAVLRGRALPLERSLGVLADAMRREFPQHMATLPGAGSRQHNIMVSALLNREPALYSIDLVVSPRGEEEYFRYTRYRMEQPAGSLRPPRMAYAGSGAPIIHSNRPLRRELIRAVNAYDTGRASHGSVAEVFARAMERVSVSSSDGTVGPDSIVAWRPGQSSREGGGQASYRGTVRQAEMPPLPTIANGMDVNAIVAVTLPHIFAHLEGLLEGRDPGELDSDAMNRELGKLPHGPDEELK